MSFKNRPNQDLVCSAKTVSNIMPSSVLSNNVNAEDDDYSGK